MILATAYSTTKPIFGLSDIDKIIQMGEMNLEDARIDSTEETQYKDIEIVLYLGGSKEMLILNSFT